ncbi:MAG TPA: flagellar hook-basal body complex protein FliE [Sphingomonas sp.]
MTAITASSLLAMRSQILQQNSALQKAAGAAPALPGTTPAAAATGGTGSVDFGKMVTSALRQVNTLQGKSEDISNAYERGDTTDIASVMLSREKASVGFQATLQVRNKLLSAYKDIMSMTV